MGSRHITISAIDAVTCIRRGLDDAALMERYQVSAHELQVIFERLIEEGYINRTEIDARSGHISCSVTVSTNGRKQSCGPVEKTIVKASDAMELIRAGMDDAGLMRKYALSAKGLQSLFTKLVANGYISEAEIQTRLLNRSSPIAVEDELPKRPAPDEQDDAVEPGPHHMQTTGPESLLFAAAGPNGNGTSHKTHSTENEPQAGFLPRSRYEIRHRRSGETIYSGDAVSLGALVQQAVADGIDLSDVDLSGADLSRADLSGARLARADLTKANLVGADLTGAQLPGAVMVSAELYGATLYKANLSDANLADSNLTRAHAVWSFMKGVNLSESNLTKADLAGANLAGADVFQAIFDRTNLTGAFLDGAELQTAKLTAAN